MACPPLMLLLVLILVNISHNNVVGRTFTSASMETKYSGKVADGEEDIYHFTLPNAVLRNSVSNIHIRLYS